MRTIFTNKDYVALKQEMKSTHEDFSMEDFINVFESTQSLNRLRLPELKIIIRYLNSGTLTFQKLKLSGTKGELIQRISEVIFTNDGNDSASGSTENGDDKTSDVMFAQQTTRDDDLSQQKISDSQQLALFQRQQQSYDQQVPMSILPGIPPSQYSQPVIYNSIYQNVEQETSAIPTLKWQRPDFSTLAPQPDISITSNGVATSQTDAAANSQTQPAIESSETVTTTSQADTKDTTTVSQSDASTDPQMQLDTATTSAHTAMETDTISQDAINTPQTQPAATSDTTLQGDAMEDS
ncbi:hypothetical protein AKO1_003517 [Acrasis kona]|uniref:Uncharacterized protein n=1 Tax=Acrasis kona TaxID=1008807 RepID=A0AAW2YHT9_9EUKA